MSANPDQVELDPGNVEALLAVRAQIAALKDTETRLRQAIEHQLGGVFDRNWSAGGLEVTMTLPLDRIV